MKPAQLLLMLMLVNWGSIIPWANACSAQCSSLKLPRTPVCYVTSEKYPGDAFLDISLKGVPPGFALRNAVYPGWCTQIFNWDLTPGFIYEGAILRDSRLANLPGHLATAWGSINYIINHKQGTPNELQCAIWYFTDGYVLPEEQQTPMYLAIIEEAQAHSDFVPGGNQLVAVILDLGPGATPQRLFVEAPCPPTNPGTRLPGYWRRHPEKWPVNSITLGTNTYCKEEALTILEMRCKHDKTIRLAKQLIAAKLNILIGNDPSCISKSIEKADLLLTAHPVGSQVSRGCGAAWCTWVSWLLEQYNQGRLSPRHASDWRCHR